MRAPGYIPLTTLLVAVTVLIVAGCSSGTTTSSSTTSGSTNPGSSGGGTVAETPNASTTEVTTQGTSGVRGGEGNAKVAVRIRGDEGIAFSGTCRVGGREETLDGETPRRYTFRLREGQPVTCEVRRTSGDGALELNMRSGGKTFIQRTDGDDAVLRASLTADAGASTSSTTSSVTSSTSVRQSGGSSSVEVSP